ncbi:MAG: hypothetical protein ACE5GT_08100 [Rhodospirillales bacterium]
MEMLEFPRLAVIGELSIYALALMPFVLFFAFRAVFNLIVACRSRAEGASWIDPSTWFHPAGYTRDGYAHLAEYVGGIGKGLLVLVPWGLLLYLAGLWGPGRPGSRATGSWGRST